MKTLGADPNSCPRRVEKMRVGVALLHGLAELPHRLPPLVHHSTSLRCRRCPVHGAPRRAALLTLSTRDSHPRDTWGVALSIRAF